MTTQDKILKAIKDATSQQPIGVLALIDQLGIDGNTMADELDALYNAKRINRCMHTKDGITQQVIWPVAVHNVSWGQFQISKPKPAATPIRTELPKATPTPPKAAPKPKHTTQLAILALLYRPEYAGGISIGQIRKYLPVADVLQYLSWYITNDFIIKKSGGKTDTLILNTKTAPKTHEALYYLRYPEKLGTIKPVADDLYQETVAAVQQVEEAPQADTFTEQIEIERKAAEQPTATVDEIEATVLRWATEQAEHTQTPLNTQVGGVHYSKLGAYQPWEVLARWLTPEELRGFAKGTVIAYLARERDKGGDLDIAKALHTLQIWETLKHTNTPTQESAA